MSSHKLLNTIDYIHTLTARSVPLVVKYKQYNQCAQADAVVIVLAVAKTDLQSVSQSVSQSVIGLPSEFPDRKFSRATVGELNGDVVSLFLGLMHITKDIHWSVFYACLLLVNLGLEKSLFNGEAASRRYQEGFLQQQRLPVVLGTVLRLLHHRTRGKRLPTSNEASSHNSPLLAGPVIQKLQRRPPLQTSEKA
ncbi:hypothetical protein DPMN_068157 [Dreissena polymorpha]|uniref:Uncharacterized protein n=1 Tax=Dreissena polymorpha TaxID=45954 RepID=A0A9D3YZA5_DREPO|nr:hypothetical protein DPMN_068157 [Dreissena polymorpha]